jgi:hypothetical protein
MLYEKRNEPTLVEKAIQAVPGFDLVFKKLSQQVTLRGQSLSTLNNYIRRIAIISLYFGKLPEQIMDDEINEWLVKNGLLKKYQVVIDNAWKKPWVVHCEPSMAGPEHVIGYLSNYTLRVAISNSRIVNVTDTEVTFLHKDYAKGAKIIPITLNGVEFLRRFCLHILPKKFVKIRKYGVYSSRHKAITAKLKPKTIDTLLRDNESAIERLFRLTGIDITLCPICKTGKLHKIAEIPKIRSPTNFYALVFTC